MIRNTACYCNYAMGIIYIFFIPADPVGFKILMKLIPMALIILFALTTRSLFSRTYKRIIITGLIRLHDCGWRHLLVSCRSYYFFHCSYFLYFCIPSCKPKTHAEIGQLLLFFFTVQDGYLDCRFTVFMLGKLFSALRLSHISS